MATITADEVRNRLDLTSSDISDAILAAVPFIPVAESIVTKILSDNGYSYSALDSDNQNLAKLAMIDACALIVISNAPREKFNAGITIEPVKASEMKAITEVIKQEFWDTLALIGCAKYQIYTNVAIGEDYTDESEDYTNLFLSHEKDDTITMYP